MKYNKSFYAR